MQNELIKISEQQFTNELKQTINARDLHQYLENKREFANWIKSRTIDFIEGIDFLTISSKTFGRPLIEYHLTLETAKHIAMIERNDKGREVRQYFIDFENKAKNQLLNLSRKQILQMALDAELKAEQLQIENQKQQSVIDQYIKIDNSKNYTETAKILGLHPNKFIDYLKQKYITQDRMPRPAQIKNGRFEIKKTIKIHPDNNIQHFESYLITPKGFDYFFEKVKEGELDFLKIVK